MPRNKPVDLAQEELIVFLSGFSLADVVSDPGFIKLLSRLYRVLHPLLIWHNLIKLYRPKHFRDTNQYTDFQHYQAEVTSDLCQAILLFSQGLYKPGYLMIRSAIENFFKCIGLYENQPAVLAIKSVYELIEVVRTLPIVSADAQYQKEFDKLHTHYVNLCAYVHTKDESFMSFTTALGGLPYFDPEKSKDFLALSRSVFSSLGIFLTAMFFHELGKLHHSDYDLILDSMPNRIKKLIF